MKFYVDREQKLQYLFQGIFLGLFPGTLITALTANPLLPDMWSTAAGIAVPLVLWGGTALLFRSPLFAKVLLGAGALLHIFILSFEMPNDPLTALLGALCGIGLFFLLFTVRLLPAAEPGPELRFNRLIGGAASLLCLTMLSPLVFRNFTLISLALPLPLITVLYLFYDYWGNFVFPERKGRLCFLFFAASAASIPLALTDNIVLPAFAAAAGCFLLTFFRKNSPSGASGSFIRNPGRCLAMTFLLLCAAGTLLLRTPVAAPKIEVIDAAFTAVSAVCVTGLSTVDISQDLTLTGKIFLLILIQAGGVGIMTVTAVVLHALGRLPLNLEHLVSGVSDEEEPGILSTLKRILKVTFACEAVGAVLLTVCFFAVKGNWPEAAGLGIFTSISAFCNAGFFPGTANLVPYAGEKFLLIIVALLITAGGVAPAVTASLFPLRPFSRLPFISRLVLSATALLLAGGTVLLLIFEWNGIFGSLSPCDKVVNAFFHTATLRTAGFNTVDLFRTGAPALLVMMLLMFAGGSPGGTAGGIKTTTLAVLFLAFLAEVRHEEDITCGGRRIPLSAVVQAAAVVMASAGVLLTVIVMLLTTQSAGARELIFESISALATVGLSLGATRELDEVGKIIVMAAMFVGKIGPLTLFLLLSDKKSTPQPGLPPVKIPLG